MLENQYNDHLCIIKILKIDLFQILYFTEIKYVCITLKK